MPQSLILAVVALLGTLSSCQTPEPSSNYDIVLSALDRYRVVAVGENHGHVEFHNWLLGLLELPAATNKIDDIAVEWGNELYQNQIDRYIDGGEVPWDSVTIAWRNTIVSPNTVWDAAVYAQFFREIRRINSTLGPDKWYRVILTDSPVDWDKVESREDLRPFYDRAAAMAETVRRESLLKGRRSLFVAGALHVARIPRRRVRDDGLSVGEITPVAWIELRNPGSVFVIQSMARAGELGLSELSTIGAPHVVGLSRDRSPGTISANATTTLRDRDGTRSNVYGDAVLADVADAVILWDASDVTLEDADASVYTIDWYWAELDRRSRIVRGQPMDPSLRR